MTNPTIAMIALNRLTRSPLNVRKTPSSQEEDNELYASVKATGIKQNLLVHKCGNGYQVHAGGRRLQVLERLSTENEISADKDIPCIIETKKQAEATSLIENFIRADMHPADEFEAFHSLVKKGWTREEIANRFGVTLNFVDRRMKLARVSPVIIEAFRANKLTLQCVQAFSITDDHGRQNEVWEEVAAGPYVPYPQSIKSALTQRTYHGTSKLARFVGVDAYEAAGGAVLRDLFSDNQSVHLADGELLEKLVRDKLQATADELAKDWKWVTLELEVAYEAFRPFGRVYPEPVDPDPALVKECEALEARIEAFSNLYDEESWTDELQAEEDAASERLEVVRKAIANSVSYSAEQRAIAGVVVTLDYAGDLRLEAGLVRPEDLPKNTPGSENDEGDDTRPEIELPVSPRAALASDDPAANMRKEQGISASLADDLRATRHQILKSHLAVDFATAFDVLLYSMGKRILRNSPYTATPINVSINHAETHRSRKVLVDTVAARMLEATEKGLNVEWLSLASPSDYQALCHLPDADKQALFAWCTAYGVIEQLGSDTAAHPVIEVIGHRMAVDAAACWRPTAENYWSRVKKDHAIKVAREQIDNRWADDRAKDKKPVIAASMEQAFSEDPRAAAGLTSEAALKTSTWLPEGMAFIGSFTERDPEPDYSARDHEDENTEEPDAEDGDFASSDEEDEDASLADEPETEPELEGDDDDIPAFLKDNAA